MAKSILQAKVVFRSSGCDGVADSPNDNVGVGIEVVLHEEAELGVLR